MQEMSSVGAFLIDLEEADGVRATAVAYPEIRLLVEEGSTRLAGWVALQIDHTQEGDD